MALFVGVAIALGIAAIVGIAYYNYRDREKSPPVLHWFNKAVVWGFVRWELSGFPARNVVVELYEGVSPPEVAPLSGEMLLIASAPTQADGYFECVNDYERYEVFFRAYLGFSEPRILLQGSTMTELRVNTPRREDLILRTPEQLPLSNFGMSEIGTIEQTTEVITPAVWLRRSDGTRFKLEGPEEGKLLRLFAHIVQVRGQSDGVYAGGESIINVQEFVIFAVGGDSTPPYRGTLIAKNAAWSVGSETPLSLESATLFLSDGRGEVELINLTPYMRRTLMSKIRYPLNSGPEMYFRGELQSSKLTVDRFKYLE
jgi:hypothetical protein